MSVKMFGQYWSFHLLLILLDSIFIAFAPKENPKIAISVLVENGYYGARWAERIASLMIEKYLKDEVTLKKTEQLVLNKSLESEYLKPYSGKPFKINQ